LILSESPSLTYRLFDALNGHQNVPVFFSSCSVRQLGDFLLPTVNADML